MLKGSIYQIRKLSQFANYPNLQIILLTCEPHCENSFHGYQISGINRNLTTVHSALQKFFKQLFLYKFLLVAESWDSGFGKT